MAKGVLRIPSELLRGLLSALSGLPLIALGLHPFDELILKAALPALPCCKASCSGTGCWRSQAVKSANPRRPLLPSHLFLLNSTTMPLQLNTASLFDVKGKVALVTGGGSGLGAMMAEGEAKSALIGALDGY